MQSVNKKRRNAVKIFGVLAVLLVLSLAFSAPVFAGTEIEGDPDVTIGADEVIKDDVFATGRNILVEGTIEGDLFASGETITITGTIEGNLIASGAVVNVGGTVDGTVFIGAYSAEIQPGAVITRNIYFGGFNLEVQPEALVERSIYAGGYQVQIGGQVARHVVAGVGAFAADGTIAGDLVLDVGHPDSTFPSVQFGAPYDKYEVEMLDPGLYLEDDVVGGEVDYHYSDMDVVIDTDFDADEFASGAVSFFVSSRARRVAGEFLTVLLLGAALLYLGKDWLNKAVDEIKANGLRDTGMGLVVYLLYLPVVLILFLALVIVVVLGSFLTLGVFTGTLMTFSSLAFSGLLGVFWLLAAYITKIVVSYLVGRWILEKTSQNGFEGYWKHFGALALGAFLYGALRMIPFLGELLALIVIVLGTGAFFFVLRDAFRRQPVEVEAAEA